MREEDRKQIAKKDGEAGDAEGIDPGKLRKVEPVQTVRVIW